MTPPIESMPCPHGERTAQACVPCLQKWGDGLALELTNTRLSLCELQLALKQCIEGAHELIDHVYIFDEEGSEEAEEFLSAMKDLYRKLTGHALNLEELESDAEDA